MTAEILREAAALMRERARCGEPLQYEAPWGVRKTDGDEVEHFGIAAIVTCEGGDGDVTDWLDDDLAEHIASWHPTVALAVAGWLDNVAMHLDAWHTAGLSPMARQSSDYAFTVARAYLGRDA